MKSKRAIKQTVKKEPAKRQALEVPHSAGEASCIQAVQPNDDVVDKLSPRSILKNFDEMVANDRLLLQQLISGMQKFQTDANADAAFDFSFRTPRLEKILNEIGVRVTIGGMFAGSVSIIDEAVQKQKLIQHHIEAQPPGQSSVHPTQETKEQILAKAMEPFDKKLVEHIKSTICDTTDQDEIVKWDDIIGLDEVKKAIQEAFQVPPPLASTDIQKRVKAIFLYGATGTGKTHVAKCVSDQCGATFFKINPLTLFSQSVGETEQLVKILFAYATAMQPSIIVIEDFDCFLSSQIARSDSGAKFKAHFLTELDTVTAKCSDNVFLLATSREPQFIDTDATRRFDSEYYLPIPNLQCRIDYIITKNARVCHESRLSAEVILKIAKHSEGYVFSDLDTVFHRAAMYAVRETMLALNRNHDIEPSDVRLLTVDDFMKALKEFIPTLGKRDLVVYDDYRRHAASR